MSLSDTYDELVTIVGGSSGITTCFSNPPGVLNTADLPAAIIRPGPAEWHQHAVASLKRQQRTYVVSVYVSPVGQGAGIYEGFKDCFAPLNALGVTLLDNMTLNNTVDGLDLPFSDEGVAVLNYGQESYHGFEMQVRVREKTT